MPGSTPATSQLDWLSSTTAMIVLSWSKATRDLLKSFSWGIGALRQLFASDDGAISSPPAPYHLSAGGRWIRTSGSWSDLLRHDALPGDLPVFLAFAGQARRRNEDHALALEAHPAHLIAADPGRIRRRVNPRDKPLAIIGVVTAIGAIFPADAGRQSVRP